MDLGMEGFYNEVDETPKGTRDDGTECNCGEEGCNCPDDTAVAGAGAGAGAGAEVAAAQEGFVNYGTGFSVMEFVKRLLKYLVEGLVVAIAAYTIPAKKLNL